MFDSSYWIQKLELLPHPEGGFYKETYRAMESNSFVMNGQKKNRNLSTAIYFLMECGNFSAFHRIQSDELWHFYTGDPLEIVIIEPSGKLEKILMGSNPENGECLQAVVPANVWFGSRPLQGSTYSLVACTVSPGFDFQDFELAQKENLLHQFPKHKQIIEELTRD